jgi:predicted glycosyltransferase
MNILFDISHPAHFHLFKNLITYLKSNDHNILITIRHKDVLKELLENASLPYYELARPAKSYPGFAWELLIRDVRMLKLCSRFKPDLLIGSSTNISHVGMLMGKPSLVFSEDDDHVIPIFSYLTYPFAKKIINPSCIEHKKWKRKRIFHNSYHELAYLHPDNFTPDVNVLKKYNLTEKKYVIARFSALKAHHDVGASGISESLWFTIEKLLGDYSIVKSFEQKKSHRIEPWDMHHLLAFAKMIISDSQTMTTEGAVLGVPAVRINTFIDKSSVLSELENKYKLAIGILPDYEDEIIKSIKAILQNPDIDQLWKVRREKLLSEKEDLNRWITDFVKKEMSFA